MLFLLNDVMLAIDLEALASPSIVRPLSVMSFSQILALGCELFAETPGLQRVSETAPRRLASLIMAKQPEVNAALFAAPIAGCPAGAVNYRVATLSVELIHNLNSLQERGALTKALVDFHVWGKLGVRVA